MIEPNAFEECKGVKRMEFLEGREALGEDHGLWNKLFRNSGVEEIVLPGTLREMPSDVFRKCDRLRVVRVAEGCPLDIRKFVGESVEVLRE